MGQDNHKWITLGGGCFWGLQWQLSQLTGVKETIAGYQGGEKTDPTYKEVCSDTTGHAEVVKIKYDSDEITLNEIVNYFFDFHDPTTLNRQGPDMGSQYRSIIFYDNIKQKKIAQDIIDSYNKNGLRAAVTELSNKNTFYKAEEYHQHYLEKQRAK